MISDKAREAADTMISLERTERSPVEHGVMCEFLGQFSPEDDWIKPSPLINEHVTKTALELGLIEDLTPRHLGASATYLELWHLLPKGRLYLKRNT
jgi:hypothetical protein